jgi:DNA-binding GntR family transcriptional regulator
MTISEQIENELRAHVLIGEAPPYSLTLNGIAKHFDVSLMPVRSAVETLVEQKFLFRGANGRLSANPRRRSRNGTKSIDEFKTPLPVAPDKRITDHIIDLSLRGVDECLREEITAEQFGIGRTVLRRILNRLAGEGIIEHLPRRGWHVRPFREKDMLDYIDLRETLELDALGLAQPRLEAGFLGEILEGNTAAKNGKPRLDNRLHRYWIDLAGNRYLSEFFDQNGIYFDTLFARAVLDDETVARRAKEHRTILKALLANDLEKAKTALSRHIRDQRNHVARLLKLSGEA